MMILRFLPYSQAKKLTCHRFMDMRRTYETQDRGIVVFLFFPYSSSSGLSIIILGPVSQAPAPKLQHKEDQVTYAHVHRTKALILGNMTLS